MQVPHLGEFAVVDEHLALLLLCRLQIGLRLVCIRANACRKLPVAHHRGD